AVIIAVSLAGIAGAGSNSPTTPAAPTTTPTNVNVVNTPTVTATVSNTSSNPVQAADVERLARIPLQITNACQGAGCQILIGFNKPGYRLVIENVTGYFALGAGTTEAPLLFLQNSNNSHGARWTFVGKLGPTVSGQVLAGFNERVLAYFDSL